MSQQSTLTELFRQFQHFIKVAPAVVGVLLGIDSSAVAGAVVIVEAGDLRAQAGQFVLLVEYPDRSEYQVTFAARSTLNLALLLG